MGARRPMCWASASATAAVAKMEGAIEEEEPEGRGLIEGRRLRPSAPRGACAAARAFHELEASTKQARKKFCQPSQLTNTPKLRPRRPCAAPPSGCGD